MYFPPPTHGISATHPHKNRKYKLHARAKTQTHKNIKKNETNKTPKSTKTKAKTTLKCTEITCNNRHTKQESKTIISHDIFRKTFYFSATHAHKNRKHKLHAQTKTQKHNKHQNKHRNNKKETISPLTLPFMPKLFCHFLKFSESFEISCHNFHSVN